MENSQIPRYLFGLSTTFPPLSSRLETRILCSTVKKNFRCGARPLHPSSSFTVLQCYTRGNPFKAGPGRAETKKAEKKRRKMWFCSNKLGGQPPRCVWRPWLSRPTNPQVESVSPVERLLEQRPNCAHLGFRGLEGICCLLPTCRFHPFPPRHVLSSGIKKPYNTYFGDTAWLAIDHCCWPISSSRDGWVAVWQDKRRGWWFAWSPPLSAPWPSLVTTNTRKVVWDNI